MWSAYCQSQSYDLEGVYGLQSCLFEGDLLQSVGPTVDAILKPYFDLATSTKADWAVEDCLDNMLKIFLGFHSLNNPKSIFIMLSRLP